MLSACATGPSGVPATVLEEAAAIRANAERGDHSTRQLDLIIHRGEERSQSSWQVEFLAPRARRLSHENLLQFIEEFDAHVVLERLLGGYKDGGGGCAWAREGTRIECLGAVRPAVDEHDAHLEVEWCEYVLRGPSSLHCHGWCTPSLFAVPCGTGESGSLGYYASDLATGVIAMACVQDLIDSLYKAGHFEELFAEVPLLVKAAAALSYLAGSRPHLLIDLTRGQQRGDHLHEFPCSLRLGSVHLVEAVLTMRGRGASLDNMMGFVAFAAWLSSRPEVRFTLSTSGPDPR